jgi:hypothetical protein
MLKFDSLYAYYYRLWMIPRLIKTVTIGTFLIDPEHHPRPLQQAATATPTRLLREGEAVLLHRPVQDTLHFSHNLRLIGGPETKMTRTKKKILGSTMTKMNSVFQAYLACGERTRPRDRYNQRG